MKKRPIDHRQEPGSGGPTKSNRVDRVFIPNSARPVAIQRDTTAQIANDLLATTRAPTGEHADAELSLRRQLSRLQRQLAESQRELANKDDEVAAEVEKRLELARDIEDQARRIAEMQAQIEQLLAYQARTAGIEERLQDSIATADELVQVNERERAATTAAQARVDELNVAFEETRALWNAERTMLEERHSTEIAQLDAQRKAAVDASADALNAQAQRLREAHEAQLAELKATHEKSLAALRGELVPKALQAHNLAEERERLITELATFRNEAIRETVEREEEYKRELQQLADEKDAVIATLKRDAAAELARAIAERDEQIISLSQAAKSAEVRAQLLEEQAEALRATLKTVQRENAELDERAHALEADKKSVDEALERGRNVIESLLADKRLLEEQVEAAEAEVRRATGERRRFVAYLEEGLALLGALPPQPEAPEIEMIENAGVEEEQS